MSRRTAITLLELLVVLAIIAVLLGLLLPAVQKVRETSVRLQSMNKMRQINLALHEYSNGYGKLPAINDFIDNGPFVVILPYLDNNWKAFISPADPSLTFQHPTNVFYPPVDKDDHYASYAYNAVVFKNKRSFESGFPDGTANTIALTEHYARCAEEKWVIFIFSLQGSAGDGGSRRPTFADEYYGDVVPVTVNGKTAPSVPDVTFQAAPKLLESDSRMPQTPHRGGILVGMMDGSVRTVGKGVLPELFWGAVTPDGGEVPGDF
jgi:type II secretory pathway pseudopilin PulG